MTRPVPPFASTAHSAATAAHSRRAFTLTELLVVIGVIVLVLAMAVPLFNVMSGDRGVEGAQNVLSAMLQRARARAIAVQEPRGLFFFENPATGEYTLCIVKIQPTQTTSGLVPAIELDPQDDEAVPLGRGAAMTSVFAVAQSSSLYNRRYLPYGVVMFDGLGRTQPTQYVIYTDNRSDPTKSSFDLIRRFGLGGILTPNLELSTNAFLLYTRSKFQKQGDDNPNQFGSRSLTWLDENGSNQIVNRYNGTLIKGD
jgi:prepilin-type N-terminal cleavage/methylation domain-containing protein